MKKANLLRDDTRTRAYLVLLAFPKGLPQGKLATRLKVHTTDMGRIYDRLLFVKTGTKNKPVWNANPGFFADSVVGSVRRSGARLSPDEREILRQWTMETYLPLFQTYGRFLPEAWPFASHVREISILAGGIETLRRIVTTFARVREMSVDDAWNRIVLDTSLSPNVMPSLLRHLRRIPDVPESVREELEQHEHDFDKGTRKVIHSLARLPDGLARKLSGTTPEGRNMAMSLETLAGSISRCLRCGAEGGLDRDFLCVSCATA